jgi:hypothetical protein
MAKLEMILKAEIVRLSNERCEGEFPLGRDVRSLKSTVSHLRKRSPCSKSLQPVSKRNGQ